MKLAIISHTEHYKTESGELVGWGPTVNEINHLAPHVEKIIHIAMVHHGKPPKSALPYTSEHISVVALPVLGGAEFKDKWRLLCNSPKVIGVVREVLKQVDAFQLRTPTGIGVFLIPYLILCSKKKGWYKYAGNWNQKQPPLGYGIQRWLLKKQSRVVTINGAWEKQPRHCLTFENPCLTKEDLLQGQQIRAIKSLNDKVNFCYVGRLERQKGVERIIKSLMELPKKLQENVGTVHLVGDGSEKEEFIKMTKNAPMAFVFHGFLAREKVFEIYKQSHFFIMPTTASEGFPKVIAEAYNFGCVPMVSDVSAIGHYINDNENGLIIKPVTTEGVMLQLKKALTMEGDSYQNMLDKRFTFVEDFSYDHYNHRILNEILRTD